METFWNDIFHAQPYALLIIAGIAFLGVAVIGSVKTYFDPGKNGRIAAGVVGLLLLSIGLFLYVPSMKPPTASAEEAAAQSVSASGDVAGATTTACYVKGKWPNDMHQAMKVGESCTNAEGDAGKAVLANDVCAYTAGPLAGTSATFKHLMYVGFNCQSPDRKSHGSAPPATAR
jgi:hypothetical protein